MLYQTTSVDRLDVSSLLLHLFLRTRSKFNRASSSFFFFAVSVAMEHQTKSHDDDADVEPKSYPISLTLVSIAVLC